MLETDWMEYLKEKPVLKYGIIGIIVVVGIYLFYKYVK